MVQSSTVVIVIQFSLIDSGHYKINNLQPATTYDVSCTAVSKEGPMRESPYVLKQVVLTRDPIFMIHDVIMHKDEISIAIESNLGMSTLCFLFNNKGLKIDSRPYNFTSEYGVMFTVPILNVPYRVQCSAFEENHRRLYYFILLIV